MRFSDQSSGGARSQERAHSTPATLAMPQTLLASFAVQAPSEAELREIWIEACRRVVADRLCWLTNEEAAAHLKMPMRTWERKKKELGVPVVKIDGLLRYLVDDLDAILLAHGSSPNGSVIKFPSVSLRQELMKGAA